MRVTWTAPDGTVWVLTDRSLGYYLRLGFSGFDAPAPTITKDPNQRRGSNTRSARWEDRTLLLPLSVTGANRKAMLSLWRGLGDAFLQTVELGPGTLTVQQPDGTERSVKGTYQGGWTSSIPWPWTFDQCIVSLTCDEPMWADSETQEFGGSFTAGSGTSFLAPFLTISSSDVLGERTVTNSGLVAVAVDWELHGPMDHFQASLLDGNGDPVYSWDFTPPESFDAGDVVVVTTDPPSVTRTMVGGVPAADNWFAGLNLPDSVLWYLPRGTSRVSFDATGGDDGTQVIGRFRRLYPLS